MKRHVRWGSQTQTFHVLLMWTQDASSSGHTDVFTHQEAHLSFGCPKFLLGFRYSGLMDWIIESQVLLSSLGIRLIPSGSKTQRSDYTVGLSLRTSQPPESSCYHELRCLLFWGPPWIAKIALWLRKFQGLRNPLLGAQDKDQILHYGTGAVSDLSLNPLLCLVIFTW